MVSDLHTYIHTYIHTIVILLGCVIGIITQIITYNEKGLFYKIYKDVLTEVIGSLSHKEDRPPGQQCQCSYSKRIVHSIHRSIMSSKQRILKNIMGILVISRYQYITGKKLQFFSNWLIHCLFCFKNCLLRKKGKRDTKKT